MTYKKSNPILITKKERLSWQKERHFPHGSASLRFLFNTLLAITLLSTPSVFAHTSALADLPTAEHLEALAPKHQVTAQSEAEINAKSKAKVSAKINTKGGAKSGAKNEAKSQVKDDAEVTAKGKIKDGAEVKDLLEPPKKKHPELTDSLSKQLIAAASERLAEYAALQRWLPYQAEFSTWLPAGAKHLAVCQQAVQLHTAPADAKPWGRISYVLECPDQPGWMLRGRVTVAVSLPVWVATEPLQREQALSPELLRLQSIDITSLHRGFISSQQAPKRRMLRDLAVAQALYPAILAPVWLVQKNEQVVIEAVGADFTVSTRGLALTNGSKGELVAVQNLDSGKRIQARVVGKSKVQTLR